MHMQGMIGTEMQMNQIMREEWMHMQGMIGPEMQINQRIEQNEE